MTTEPRLNEPSTPSSRDAGSTAHERGRQSDRPTLVGATAEGVAFLHAPGVDAGILLRTVADVLDDMTTGGISPCTPTTRRQRRRRASGAPAAGSS